MSRSPYRNGQRSFHNCYANNPHAAEPARSEWQRGYDDAAEADHSARQAVSTRRDNLWNVPERARDEYIAMEDDFSAQTVLEFMLAMHPEQQD